MGSVGGGTGTAGMSVAARNKDEGWSCQYQLCGGYHLGPNGLYSGGP